MSHPTYDFLTPAARRYLPVKRALDVLLSGCGIVVLSPVLLGEPAWLRAFPSPAE